MRLPLLEMLSEANYKGNIGMMEMIKFYQIATEDQKREMKDLITAGRHEQAWHLLQTVTGQKLS